MNEKQRCRGRLSSEQRGAEPDQQPQGSPADPSAHNKYLVKVFPVVSVINGPLTQSMNQVSRVNLQEALLGHTPLCPPRRAWGGDGSGGGGGAPHYTQDWARRAPGRGWGRGTGTKCGRSSCPRTEETQATGQSRGQAGTEVLPVSSASPTRCTSCLQKGLRPRPSPGHTRRPNQVVLTPQDILGGARFAAQPPPVPASLVGGQAESI